MNKKIAVVTGASSGIGAAIAAELLENDFKVLLNARTCQSEHINAIVNQSDMTCDDTAEALLHQVLDEYGGCDYLFVNAGIIETGTIENIDIDRVCKMARLKVEASYRLIYTFLKYFKTVNKGHIIITSSVLGTKTRETSGAYAGCNYALEALAESLRMELSDTDIQISCIEPGLVETNLHRNWEIKPKDLLSISHALTPQDIAMVVRDIINKPEHIRIPRYMILPKGHKI